MTDKVEEIVNRSIEHTLTILAALPDIWPAARAGLERILDDLAANEPDHPALRRLREFIVAQDRGENAH